MKVLLDENLPHDLRHELAAHDTFTVAYMGWGGIGNGQLLALAAQHGFDVVLTKDLGIPNQQNVDQLPVALVVIRAPSNSIEILRPMVPSILAALESVAPMSVVYVESAGEA